MARREPRWHWRRMTALVLVVLVAAAGVWPWQGAAALDYEDSIIKDLDDAHTSLAVSVRPMPQRSPVWDSHPGQPSRAKPTAVS